MDDFIAEAKAKKIRTLDELNHYWKIFLEEYYHNKAHEGIRERRLIAAEQTTG